MKSLTFLTVPVATLIVTLVSSGSFMASASTKDSIAEPDIRIFNYEHRINTDGAQKSTATKERMAVLSLPEKSAVRGSTVMLTDVMSDIQSLKFIASNKYGNSKPETVSISTTSGIRPDLPEECTFMIFDEESNLIKSGSINEYNDSYTSLKAGHYIVRYYNEDGFNYAEQIYKAF